MIRRAGRWGGAMLAILVWLAPAPVSRAEPQAAPAAGQLLVAAPGIGDPRFDGTVIFIVKHDSKGAMGIVINRPVGTHPMADLLLALGAAPKSVKGIAGNVRIFSGGPMEPDIGFVIHTPDYHDPRTITIDKQVSLTSDSAILRAIAKGTGPKRSLVAFGYAGWGPGQLENELEHNDWYVVPADPELLFGADRDSVWQRAYDKRRLRL